MSFETNWEGSRWEGGTWRGINENSDIVFEPPAEMETMSTGVERAFWWTENEGRNWEERRDGAEAESGWQAGSGEKAAQWQSIPGGQHPNSASAQLGQGPSGSAGAFHTYQAPAPVESILTPHPPFFSPHHRVAFVQPFPAHNINQTHTDLGASGLPAETARDLHFSHHLPAMRMPPPPIVPTAPTGSQAGKNKTYQFVNQANGKHPKSQRAIRKQAEAEVAASGRSHFINATVGKNGLEPLVLGEASEQPDKGTDMELTLSEAKFEGALHRPPFKKDKDVSPGFLSLSALSSMHGQPALLNPPCPLHATWPRSLQHCTLLAGRRVQSAGRLSRHGRARRATCVRGIPMNCARPRRLRPLLQPTPPRSPCSPPLPAPSDDQLPSDGSLPGGGGARHLLGAPARPLRQRRLEASS